MTTSFLDPGRRHRRRGLGVADGLLMLIRESAEHLPTSSVVAVRTTHPTVEHDPAWCRIICRTSTLGATDPRSTSGRGCEAAGRGLAPPAGGILRGRPPADVLGSLRRRPAGSTRPATCGPRTSTRSRCWTPLRRGARPAPLVPLRDAGRLQVAIQDLSRVPPAGGSGPARFSLFDSPFARFGQSRSFGSEVRGRRCSRSSVGVPAYSGRSAKLQAAPECVSLANCPQSWRADLARMILVLAPSRHPGQGLLCLDGGRHSGYRG